MKSNREYLTNVQKADMSLDYLKAQGGELSEEHADKFLRLLIKKAVIMPSMTVFGMTEFKRRVPTIRFGDRVLRAGVPGQAIPSGDRARPDIGKFELDAQLFKATVVIEQEVFEDNVELDGLRNTLMQILTDAIARDIEYVVIQGDTSSSDDLLSVLDGLLIQATSHVVDVGGGRLDKSELHKSYKALPSQYRVDPRTMRIWTGANPASDYDDSLADRQTALGDKYLDEHPGPRYKLTPVVGVPEFPEDLGGGSNYSAGLLLNPKNVHVGFHKKVEIRVTEDIESAVTLMVARTRFDVKFANEDGVVKLTNILAD